MKKYRFKFITERFDPPLTVKDAMRYYSASRSTVYRMMRAGLIEYERDARTGRIRILSGPQASSVLPST
jgi:predicted DNA-binding transcriptional regulator AlpA